MTVTIDDVRTAAAQFGADVRRTPLLASATLSALTGADVRLKAENLQFTGSFKVRGASNRIAALSAEQSARGVIAASAGNHAQGVAVAARGRGVRATVVMPTTTPLAKVQATRGYGGDVILHGEHYEEARAEASRLAAERGLVAISAFRRPANRRGSGHGRTRDHRRSSGGRHSHRAGRRRRADRGHRRGDARPGA